MLIYGKTREKVLEKKLFIGWSPSFKKRKLLIYG